MQEPDEILNHAYDAYNQQGMVEREFYRSMDDAINMD